MSSVTGLIVLRGCCGCRIETVAIRAGLHFNLRHVGTVVGTVTVVTSVIHHQTKNVPVNLIPIQFVQDVVVVLRLIATTVTGIAELLLLCDVVRVRFTVVTNRSPETDFHSSSRKIRKYVN